MLKVLGYNQKDVRSRNKRLVLTILREEGALPKVDIARLTGLSSQAVSVITRGLERDGLIERGERQRGKVGQPSIPMSLARQGAYFVGLEIGKTQAEIVFVNMVGEILYRADYREGRLTPKSVCAFANEAIESFLSGSDNSRSTKVLGAGVVFSQFRPSEAPEAWLEEMSQLGDNHDFSVFFGYESTCACNAELIFGRSNLPRDFLYIYVGDTIGGGVVLNGSLYRGRDSKAGSIGFFPIDGQDAEGRLSDIGSLKSLRYLTTVRGHDARWQISDREDWGFPEGAVSGWLDEAAPAMAHAIVGAAAIFEFSNVVIDGPLSEGLRRRIVDKVGASVGKRSFDYLSKPKILPGSLGNDAVPLGAASLPISRLFMLEG